MKSSSVEGTALAFLFLCCQTVMLTSIKHHFRCSKPAAGLHIQLVMLISTACSVQDGSKTSIKIRLATSNQTRKIDLLVLCRHLLAACYNSLQYGGSSEFKSCCRALERVSRVKVRWSQRNRFAWNQPRSRCENSASPQVLSGKISPLSLAGEGSERGAVPVQPRDPPQGARLSGGHWRYLRMI